jgi:hypothetical protein
MAEFEHERGIAATYFILPHNDFYDPFSPEGRRALRRLVEMGHEIGLHCDTAVYPEEPAQLRREVLRDLDAFAAVTGQKVVSASQHIPIDRRVIDLSDFVDVDTYAPWVREKFAYVSDSSMCWRTTPWEVLPSRKSVQLLTHPIWWMAPGETQRDKFRFLKSYEASHQRARLDGMLKTIERYLADREKLDARLSEEWRKLHGGAAAKVSQS